MLISVGCRQFLYFFSHMVSRNCLTGVYMTRLDSPFMKIKVREGMTCVGLLLIAVGRLLG